jgi:hypothetical protein
MPDPLADLANLSKFVWRLPIEAQALATIVNSGMIGPERPDRLLAMYRAFDRYGPVGALITVAAIRHGDRTGLVDELGSLTYAEMDRRSNALAHALRARGIGDGDGVGILCRNHRGMFDASYGVLKAGARALYLNTDFAGPQAAEVCAREGARAVIYDEEFAGVVADVVAPQGRLVAWTDYRVLDRGRRQDSSSPAEGSRLCRHADQRHYRPPKGGHPVAAPLAHGRGCHPVADPVSGPRIDVYRPAAVSRLGAGDVGPRHRDGLDDGRPPPLRPRSHPCRRC